MTIRMVDRQGNVVVVEDSAAARAAFESGQLGFEQGSRVSVRDARTGEVGTVPATQSDLQESFGAGFELATGAQVTQARDTRRRQEAGTFGGVARTFVEGIARSPGDLLGQTPEQADRIAAAAGAIVSDPGAALRAGLPLADDSGQLAIRTGRPSEAAIAEQLPGVTSRREANPLTSAAGGIALDVAALAGSGGTSGALTASRLVGRQALGAVGRRALTRAGAEAGSGALARAAAVRAGERAVAGRVAQTAAELGTVGAIEGGLIGGARAVTETALGPSELTAEHLASGIGMGVLLGGGGGAVLGGLGRIALEGARGAARIPGRIGAARAARVAERDTLAAAAARADDITLSPAQVAQAESAADEAIAAGVSTRARETEVALQTARMRESLRVADAPTAQARAAASAADGSTEQSLSRMWERTEGVELSEGVAQAAMTRLADASATAVGGEQRAAIRELTALSPAGRRAREIADRGIAPIEEAAATLRPLLDDGRRASEGVMAAAQQLKPEAVRRVLQPGAVARAGDESLELVDEALGLADFIRASPAEIRGTAAANRLLKLAEGFDDRVLSAIERNDGLDLFLSMDEFKRGLGRLHRSPHLAGTKIRELYESRFIPHLEDTRLWGGAGTMQQRLNQGWTPLIGNDGGFGKVFLSDAAVDGTIKGVRDGFATLRTHDPAKLQTFLERVGTGKNKLNEEIFEAQMVNQRRMADTVEEFFELTPELTRAVSQSRSHMQTITRTVREANDSVRISNQMRGLQQAQSQGAQISGTGIGAGVGAVLGTVTGVGPFIGGAIGGFVGNLASNPLRLVRSLGLLERATSGSSNRLTSGVRSYIKSVTGRARRAAAATGEGVGRVTRAVSGPVATAARIAPVSMGAEEYRAAIAQLVDFRSNPMAANDLVAERTRHVQEVAPQLASSLVQTMHRASGFLHSRIPPGSLPRNTVLGRITEPPIVSDAQIAEFSRYVRAVGNPQTIISDMQAGRLSIQAVEAMREVYPQMYQQVVATVMETMSSTRTRPDYEARLQLGTLLGVATDPSLEPEFIAAIQAMHAASSGEEQPQEIGAPPAPPAPSSAPANPPDTASASLSDSQRLAARRTG